MKANILDRARAMLQRGSPPERLILRLKVLGVVAACGFCGIVAVGVAIGLDMPQTEAGRMVAVAGLVASLATVLMVFAGAGATISQAFMTQYLLLIEKKEEIQELAAELEGGVVALETALAVGGKPLFERLEREGARNPKVGAFLDLFRGSCV